MADEISVYVPTLQPILLLKSLVEVETNSRWPAYPFQNPNLQTLGFTMENSVEMPNVESYLNCLRMFPSIASLEVPFDSLFNQEIILAINNLGNLREFTINGQSTSYGDLTRNELFLEKLLIKNLEKVTFLRYSERNCRVQFYDRFTRNHPKIKEFKIEADDFGMGAVRVIVRNLENLEKFVFETEDTKFEWDLEKLNDFRKICDC